MRNPVIKSISVYACQRIGEEGYWVSLSAERCVDRTRTEKISDTVEVQTFGEAIDWATQELGKFREPSNVSDSA